MGGEVHRKAVAEQTEVRTWIKSSNKLIRTSENQRNSSFGSCSCESLGDRSLHSFYFLKPLNWRGTETSTRSQFPKLGDGPLHSTKSKEWQGSDLEKFLFQFLPFPLWPWILWPCCFLLKPSWLIKINYTDSAPMTAATGLATENSGTHIPYRPLRLFPENDFSRQKRSYT